MHGKLSQEYPVNVGVPQSSILGPTLFLLYINDLADDVICNFNIYADDTTLCSKCDQTSDLRQQLDLAIELESDITLVDFNAGKTQLVLFGQSNNSGAIDVKTDGSFLDEKSFFKMSGLSFGDSFIVSITESVSKKIGASIFSMKFLSPEVTRYLYKFSIQLCMEYCCLLFVNSFLVCF